ncbi:MarR family winged helix-turn-helix transcriptional regulator [Filimonas effusa]|uniref:MarR family transcriptional regulator n=1 Tax=Filimonas effusa TaxID=2508721 RepID=A0A4Q1DBH0_9BACT|nr:MarR family transcriptional regulator [Filimonas effusa]RXK86801.1 MarR family transcriptional regulator [Filimonas effusa]
MRSRKSDTLAAFLFSMVKLQMESKVFIRNKLKENNIDLTYEMLQVLILLWRRDGVNQQEIAGFLHKDKTSVTYLIDNLSKRGLVLRSENPDDRRNKHITVTPEGLRLKEVVPPLIEEMYDIAGNGISSLLFKEGIELCEKVRSNLLGKKEEKPQD